MKFIFLGFALLALNFLQAQDRPIFFPEDIESTTLTADCLCKPGVTNKSRGKGIDISFLHVDKAELNEEEGFPLSNPKSELTLQQLSIKLRFPIINKEGLKLLGGLVYRSEHFDFKRIGADYQSIFNYLNGKNLKSNGLEAIMTKSWNEKNYSSFRFRVLYNGDYSGIVNTDRQYAIYSFSGLYGVKKTNDKEWGIGLNFSHSFRRTLVLPFVLYNHTFNKKWGIEMVLPAIITLRRNFSDKSILFAGLRYSSRSYSIDIEQVNQEIFNLNHSEIRGALTLQQRVHPWIWFEGMAGVQYNFSTDFESRNNDALSFEVEPGTSPFIKIGIFVSPPDSFFK